MVTIDVMKTIQYIIAIIAYIIAMRVIIDFWR